MAIHSSDALLAGVDVCVHVVVGSHTSKLDSQSGITGSDADENHWHRRAPKSGFSYSRTTSVT